MKFYFATCAQIPDGTDDDKILAAELVSQGHLVEFKIWSDSGINWSAPDRTVVRSTWDYQRDLTGFLKWAETTPNLVNDFTTIKSNCDKRYLAATPHAVHSRFVSKSQDLERELEEALRSSSPLVLKPSVSASAELTFKTTTRDEALQAGREILAKRGDVLIQPFIESIATLGEISLVYFANRFSHAIVKRPKAGDFRVQQNFGGTLEPYTPSQKQLAIAEAALPKTTYARVDMVDYETEPKIGELELIEPELFFRTNPNAAKNAVRAFTGA